MMKMATTITTTDVVMVAGMMEICAPEAGPKNGGELGVEGDVPELVRTIRGTNQTKVRCMKI